MNFKKINKKFIFKKMIKNYNKLNLTYKKIKIKIKNNINKLILLII